MEPEVVSSFQPPVPCVMNNMGNDLSLVGDVPLEVNPLLDELVEISMPYVGIHVPVSVVFAYILLNTVPSMRGGSMDYKDLVSWETRHFRTGLDQIFGYDDVV